MRVHQKLLIGYALAALLACSSTPPARPEPPQVVEVPVVRYIELPAYLLQDCPIAEGRLAEVIDVANARKASLVACNGHKAELRRLQGRAIGTNP